jgi:hypothetical protein
MLDMRPFDLCRLLLYHTVYSDFFFLCVTGLLPPFYCTKQNKVRRELSSSLCRLLLCQTVYGDFLCDRGLLDNQ